MSTSGSIDFKLTCTQLITQAMRKIARLGKGQTIDADDLSMALIELNMMIKEWQGDGVFIWNQGDGVVFINETTNSYSIGASGDHACALSDLVKTAVYTAASSGATTLVVDSSTNMATSDYIGIELADGTRQWTTISSISTNTLTLAAALTDDVEVDATVYTYTTRLKRPLKIDNARYMDTINQERPIRSASRQEWQKIVSKDNTYTTSIPTLIYYNPNASSAGTLNVWPWPSTVNGYIVFNYSRDFYDYDSVTDDSDFPVEATRAIVNNLAVALAPLFRVNLSEFPDVVQQAQVSYRRLRAMLREREDIEFKLI